MQYSDIVNKNGIIQRVEMLTGTGDGAISGDAVLLKQVTGLVNESYFEVFMAGMSVDRNASADDYNYNDYPDAPITMVLGQADYSIPVAVTGGNVASFLRLKGIYFKKDGNRQYLSPMDDSETLTDTAGEPTSYKLNGKSIFFQCPLSAETLSKYSTVFYVEFQRVPDAFTSADTTQQPGILETYHDLIPLRTSAKMLLPTNPNLAQQYDVQFYTRLMLYKRDVANMDDKAPNFISVEAVNPY